MTAPAPFPGWSVVRAAFVVAFFAWGLGFYGPGVFLQTLHATKGWPIATISAAISAHFLIGAIIVAFLPEVHRGIGLANSTILGAVSTALGIVAWAMAALPVHLFAAAAVSGLGWALTSGAAINAMVEPWFDRDRPRAISHAFNGASIGGVVFTPLLVALIAAVGFGTAALLAGLATVLVVAPLAHAWLRHRPEDMGLARDGGPAVVRPIAGEAARLPRRALVATSAFATLSSAFALALFAQAGVLSHLLVRLSPHLGTVGTPLAVSLTTVSAIAGRMMLAWLIGGHDRRLAASVNFLVQAAGLGLLGLSDMPALLVAGCVLFGLGVGNVAAIPALIAQRDFRSADVGTVVALVVAINQAVFALAPVIFGAVRDSTTDYAVSFAIAAGIEILAAAIVLIGRRTG